MQIGEFDVYCPMMLGGERSEAEVLGAVVWLWMHSSQHRDIPLHALPTVLLPIIKLQQYALVSRKGKALFFLSWMWMDEEAERRYLTQPAIMVQESDWACGERMWIRDWIAPFGDTFAMRNLVGSALFPDRCLRALYHRGATKGTRVMNFRGDNVTHQQALEWRIAHPLSTPVKQMPVRTLS